MFSITSRIYQLFFCGSQSTYSPHYMTIHPQLCELSC